MIQLFHDYIISLVLKNANLLTHLKSEKTCNKDSCWPKSFFIFKNIFFNLCSHIFSTSQSGTLSKECKPTFFKYQPDGSLFDLHRLDTKTKTFEEIILEALFTDDCALMVHRESDLQLIVSKFDEASRLSDLTFSLGKTEILCFGGVGSRPR